MAAYKDIRETILGCQTSEDAFDVILGTIKTLSSVTRRNTIVYYSMGVFAGNVLPQLNDFSINEEDRFSLAAVCRDLDPSKGLDLIINTLGGDMMAGIAIGDYLREKFGNNIRVIVPQIAMSMGTALSFVGREILMDESSCLGMIDPIYNGMPCLTVLRDYDRVKDGKLTEADRINFEKYPVGAFSECNSIARLMGNKTFDWLRGGMFADETDEDARRKIKGILEALLFHSSNLRHHQRVNATSAAKFGLKIRRLDESLQLSQMVNDIHDAIVISLNKKFFPKLTLSQDGNKYVGLLYK